MTVGEIRELLTLTGGKMDYDLVKAQMRRLLYDFSKASSKRVVGKGVYLAAEDEPEDSELTA
eukprot:3756018-Amphidinium_carterae.1